MLLQNEVQNEVKQTKAGIERLNIINDVSGNGAYRFNIADPYHKYMNMVYRSIFNLYSDDIVVDCTPEEKLARYDIDFGVDIILNLNSGQPITIQEKVLTTSFDTVTVEYYQNWRTKEKGDWFKLKCDYYFVGYIGPNNKLRIWILIDWNKLKLQSQLKWDENFNQNDGAMASFRYLHFNQIPTDCIIAMWYNKELTKNI